MAVSKEDVLKFHSHGRAGKIEIALTKKIENAQDLSTAYSPGVAFPCLEIQKDPSLAYDYTSKANTVAIISNGTAVLGLGDIGDEQAQRECQQDVNDRNGNDPEQ